MRRWLPLLLLLPPGCGTSTADPSDNSLERTLRLATTTSIFDSGLLEELLPRFEKTHNARVDVIAVGTGQALKLGQQGDVDVLLVHSREAELAFLKAGHAIRREEVMYNTFLLLGPASDPAGIRGRSPHEALQAIRQAKARFLSRGDRSGTHRRELNLWELGGGHTPWEGYLETVRGMGATLVVADEMEAYVLADRGTFLVFRRKISLVPLVEEGQALHNPYGVLLVNPDKHAAIDEALAGAFVDFLMQPETRRAIAAFRVDGEVLFHPHTPDHATDHNGTTWTSSPKDSTKPNG